MDNAPTTRLSLLARLRSPRDERAWAEFLAIYGPLIDRLARARGLQAADAADVTQEVFHAVASAIDRWDPDPGRGSFRAWLFRIARNLTMNFLVRHKRHPRGAADTDVKDLLEAIPPPRTRSRSRRNTDDNSSTGRRTGSAGNSGGAWRAFWMTGVEGRPASEAAEALGTTVGTVYFYKSRVMARLRREVEQVEGGPRDDE